VLDARRVHVDLWVRQLLDAGTAGSSTKHRLSALTSFYRHLPVAPSEVGAARCHAMARLTHQVRASHPGATRSGAGPCDGEPMRCDPLNFPNGSSGRLCCATLAGGSGEVATPDRTLPGRNLRRYGSDSVSLALRACW
jgi:hypothetical protein